MRFLALHREAMASARSQKTATALIFLIISGMCLAVFLTSGRTAAAEAAVLSHIDDQATRTIVLRATGDDAGLDTRVLQSLDRIQGVDAVLGLGPTQDMTNTDIPGGNRIAVRTLYTAGPVSGLPERLPPLSESVVVSPQASYELGLAGGAHGSVQDDTGRSLPVTSLIAAPPYLDFLEPLALIPTASDSISDQETLLATIVLVTKNSADVELVAGVARDLASPLDPEHLTIETAEQLGEIRQAISGDLGSFGRATVLGILAVTAALVAVNLYGLVMLRRKDFGRRRALGATRGMVIGLLLWQVGVVAALAATIGTVASMVLLYFEGERGQMSLPDTEFVLAVAALAIIAAVAAAVPPAFYAAGRDPLKELRVP